MGKKDGLLILSIIFLLVFPSLIAADNHTIDNQTTGDTPKENSEFATKLSSWLAGESNFWDIFLGFFQGIFNSASNDDSLSEEDTPEAAIETGEETNEEIIQAEIDIGIIEEPETCGTRTLISDTQFLNHNWEPTHPNPENPAIFARHQEDEKSQDGYWSLTHGPNKTALSGVFLKNNQYSLTSGDQVLDTSGFNLSVKTYLDNAHTSEYHQLAVGLIVYQGNNIKKFRKITKGTHSWRDTNLFVSRAQLVKSGFDLWDGEPIHFGVYTGNTFGSNNRVGIDNFSLTANEVCPKLIIENDFSIFSDVVESIGDGWNTLTTRAADCEYAVSSENTCFRQEGVYRWKDEFYTAFVEDNQLEITEESFRNMMESYREENENISSRLGYGLVRPEGNFYTQEYQGYSINTPDGGEFIWYSDNKIVGIKSYDKKMVYDRGGRYTYLGPNIRYDPNKGFVNLARAYGGKHPLENLRINKVCIDNEQGQKKDEGSRNTHFGGRAKVVIEDWTFSSRTDHCVQGDLENLDPRFTRAEELGIYRESCTGSNCGVNDFICNPNALNVQGKIYSCKDGCSNGACICVNDADCGFSSKCNQGACELSDPTPWFWEESNIPGVSGDYDQIINDIPKKGQDLPFLSSKQEVFYDGCILGLDLGEDCESYAGNYNTGSLNRDFGIVVEKHNSELTQEAIVSALDKIVSQREDMVSFEFGYQYNLGYYGERAWATPYMIKGNDYSLILWHTEKNEIIVTGSRPSTGFAHHVSSSWVTNVDGGLNIAHQIMATPYLLEHPSITSPEFFIKRIGEDDPYSRGVLELWRGNVKIFEEVDYCAWPTEIRKKDGTKYNGLVKVDSCSEEGCTLIEFYQSSPLHSGLSIRRSVCENGCSDGACIR